MEARSLPDGRTEACFYGTMVPRIPVLGDAFIVMAARMMKAAVEKDMESLKAYCERRVSQKACQTKTAVSPAI